MSHRQYMDSYDAQIGDPSSRPDIRLLPLPHNYDYDKPLYTGCYIAPSQHEARLYHQRGAAAWDAVQEACDNSTSDHHVEPEGFAPHYQRNHIQVQPSVMRAKAKTCPGISVPQQGAPQHSQQRSVLLEDFDFRTMTTSKPSKWELVDARGHIVEFSKDQHGSRFIQLKLETAKPDIKDIVFSEVAPVALQLMTDVFGNYVIQKFFDHGNPQHITQLMRVIQGHMLDLALHMYGCRVIQKALESTDDLDLKLDLICELQGHVLHCIKDQNGNHVIQKCIEILPWKVPSVVEDMSRASFLLESFENNVDTMSTHPYGCRVIQRVLEKCSDEQMAPILREIQDSYGLLVNDQYGNYVIQHVLQHGPPSQRTALINRIYPDIIRFSYHKFSSNVIEKCLSYASVKQLRVIMHHILNSSDNGECPLQIMMKDQYANYVVQKLIDVADSTERDKMAAIIKSHAANLKRYTHGKHILNRLEKLTGQKII
ncbi:hypothetical protein DYB32_005366 [Aphanomyces invadans]|nr:hypothetical protein DYB32_005366 [Aphanomyces invadans]